MANEGDGKASIHRVVVLGDNRLSSTILSSLSLKTYELHQVIHHRSSSSVSTTVQSHKSDWSRSSVSALFRELRPDLIISTQSGGSYETQRQLIDCAIEADVRRFMPMEFGQDCLNPNLWTRSPPLREKARVIAYLQEQASQRRISWVGVATGYDIEHGLSSGKLGFDLKWQSATIHGTGHERFAASSSGWPGRVTSAVIEHWEKIQNKYLYASGMTVDASSVVKCLREETSSEWQEGHIDIADTLREAEQRFERGYPDAGMFLMERSILFDEALEAVRSFDKNDAKEALGLQSELLEQLVSHVVHKHKHHDEEDCGCS